MSSSQDNKSINYFLQLYLRKLLISREKKKKTVLKLVWETELGEVKQVSILQILTRLICTVDPPEVSQVMQTWFGDTG